MARTDTHRPSAINPEEYVFVSFHDHREDTFQSQLVEMAAFRDHMLKTGGKFSTHEHGGVCHICGNANAMTVARFWHQPTNTYIEVGETCADKLWSGDKAEFASFRAKIKAGIEAATGKRKARRLFDDYALPTDRMFAILENWSEDDQFEEITIRDIVQRTIRYGFISYKQVEFVRKLFDKIDNRAKLAAERAAEAAAALPIPAFDGRTTIEGEVIAVKQHYGFYGAAIKITVKHADGWKVWGTAPAGATVVSGMRVRFDAAITPTDNDPKFGFFARPTKFEIIQGEK